MRGIGLFVGGSSLLVAGCPVPLPTLLTDPFTPWHSPEADGSRVFDMTLTDGERSQASSVLGSMQR